MRVVKEEKVQNYSSLLFQIVGVIARLGAQSAELNRTKNKLQKGHDELEMRVEERTAELAKTTEYLRREKERAEEYLNIAGVMLAMLDVDEKISRINKRGCEILGYKEKELIGRNWFDTLVPQRIRGEIRGIFGKLMAGDIEPVEYYENTLLTKDGEERLISFHNTVIRDKNSQAVGVLFSGEDITKRKQAEEMVLQSEEKYRTIVESINDIVFSLDGKGKFTYLSPRFEVATGYLPEDLIGLSFTEVLAPEYIESTLDSFIRGLSGETIPLYEVELLLRDGRRHPIELNVTSILDAERQPIGRLGVARDISERKKREDKLQRSEALYRTIFEATSVPTAILDEEGTFYRVNAEAAKISGFTKEELEGKKSWIEFIAKKEDLEMMKEIHRLRRTDPDKVPRNYEFLFKGRYGNLRNIYVTAAVIPRTKRRVVSFMDLTERQRAEQQIKASLREKEVLLKEIHHRVKNNLQVIVSLLNLQSKHVKDKHDLEIFKDSQNRIKSMAFIHDKLYQSKDLASIDFAEYIENLASHLFTTYSVSSSAIKLVADVKDVPLDINSAIPCGLIINELISNSLKYAFPDGQGGKILIKLYASKDDTFTLIISDKGIGLPEDLDFRNTESLGLQV
jgi:PAS domain S-box-containing protein